MSQVLINQYLAQLDVLKKVGGTHRESVVREAFKDLLKGWGKQHDLVFIPEYELDSATKDTRFVDGAQPHELRVPFGYCEAKDAKAFLYGDRLFNDRLTENHVAAFGPKLNESNEVMMICGHPQIAFTVHAISGLPDAGYASRATQMFPRYVFGADGTRIDNITDWSLAEFKTHYQPGRGKRPSPQPSPRGRGSNPITKEAIFHYVYAVLHDPQYRETYAQNLKREFPRIPLYGESESNFWQWATWGEALMALHIGYEQVAPFTLVRTDMPDEKVRASGQSPKCILKPDKDAGTITLDSETTLTGVPREAWAYTLGNRCAIDWVLDQHKEKKPKDPTIRAKFDTYRFADHKEKVIELLKRVTAVSVATVGIVAAMKVAAR